MAIEISKKTPDFSTFDFLFRFLAIYNQPKKKG
jgi:hypothetical protein